MAEVVVLDTSAFFTLLEDEAGADVVENCLLDAKAGVIAVHASFVTLTEVEYITIQEQGAEAAASVLAKVKAWPVSWQHSDDTVCAASAKLKAAHRISFADAFVASLAQSQDATLIHKDPEFNGLSGLIKQQMLPAKSPR